MGWLFDDDEEDEYKKKDKNRQYTNGEITVFWQPDKCIHATYCYKELLEVFNPRNRPWVNMQGSTTEKIIETVNMCPTDALTWRWNDPDKNKHETNLKIKQAIKFEEKQTEQDVVSIQVVRDGPLLIKGKYKLIGANGKELKAMPITSFCRCGGSHNMPFCDGSHRKIGFQSDK